MINFKGIREGILITAEDAPWPEIHTALLKGLDEQGEFLKGARLALDVGGQELKAVDLGSLRDEISERGFSLWAVLSTSPVTEQTAQVLGLATRLHTAFPERSKPSSEPNVAGEEALFVRRTLRSGFKLQFPGAVVVLGDVNPGAEIIAGGDVIIWGKLKGMVHAGALGDESAVVCALELAPTQLRIADTAAITPQKNLSAVPEMARLQDGQLLAESWNPG